MTRFRSFRRPAIVVGLATMLTTLVTLSGPAAAVESERIVGPVTGSTYDMTFSCPTGAMQRVIRSDAGRSVEADFTIFDGEGTEIGGASTTFTSFAGLPPFVLGNSNSRNYQAGSWTVSERFEGEGNYVEAGRISWECPDYEELPSTAFSPITPTRVLDTRSGSLLNYAGGKPGAGQAITIDASMLPDLPAGVVAVSATVGLVQSEGRGFVQLLPSGATPGASANVNSSGAGENVVNGAVSVVGAGGAVDVYTSASAHLIIDVNGYYVAAAGVVAAGRAVVVEPVRVFDTRAEFQLNHSGGRPVGGSTITVDLTNGSPLPASGAAAAIVNVGVARTAPGRGFVQAAAGGTLVPGETSILNTSGVNDVVSALAVVPVANDGSIDLYTAADADIIVDVLGWFTNDSAPPSETGKFVPIDPDRIFDSRLAAAPVNCCGELVAGTIDQLTGRRAPDTSARVDLFAIQDFAGAVFINLALVAASNPGYLQAAESEKLEVGASSNVNAGFGENVSNAAIVPIGERFPGSGFTVYTSGGGHIVADIAGFYLR